VSLRNGIKGKPYHLIFRYIGLCVDFGDGLHQLKIVLGIVLSISTKIRETKIKEVTPDKYNRILTALA